MREIKNELGNHYGSYEVTAYTGRRATCNGCVIWECTCTQCGTKYHFNGNNLRFNKIGSCPVCKLKLRRMI